MGFLSLRCLRTVFFISHLLFSSPPLSSSYILMKFSRTYLIDTGTPPDPYTGFYAYSFLYQGNHLLVCLYIISMYSYYFEGVNTGNGAAAKAPITCSIFTPLLAVNDTGNIPLHLFFHMYLFLFSPSPLPPLPLFLPLLCFSYYHSFF